MGMIKTIIPEKISKIITGTLLFTVISTSTVTAATLIQSRDAQNSLSSIYIDKNKARIEMPNNDGFIVMDISNKTMKAVIHEQRTVLDMSEFMQEDNSTATPQKHIDTYSKTMGLGPTIVGYETEEYGLYANDQYCGSLFVSVDAMRDIGLKKFARAFMNIDKNIQSKMSSLTGQNMGAMVSPCTEATRKASLRLQDIGFPLKTTNSQKQLISVVTKVKKNTSLPANAFVIPADYKVMDPAKMMNEAMKNIQPQMQQMMKNMTPEMQRMMQQQMQQYQP